MNTIDRLLECLLEGELESTCDITREHVHEAIQILAGTEEPPPSATSEEWIDLHEVLSMFLERLPPSDRVRKLITKAIREEIT